MPLRQLFPVRPQRPCVRILHLVRRIDVLTQPYLIAAVTHEAFIDNQPLSEDVVFADRKLRPLIGP